MKEMNCDISISFSRMQLTSIPHPPRIETAYESKHDLLKPRLAVVYLYFNFDAFS